MSRGNVPPEVASRVSLKRQMMLLDGLPANLRSLVHMAPVALDLQQVYGLKRNYGPAQAEQRLTAVLKEQFPLWVPG